MLYVFAGHPKTGLHAGGLQLAIETVEELGILEHDPAIQYRKEGVFTPGLHGELLYPIEFHLSDLLLQDGISWDWFPENWSFGNGVTTHKTTAYFETKVVIHGTDFTLEEWLRSGQTVNLSQLTLNQIPANTEGWQKYEARWVAGTCPQEDHIVRLTWLVMSFKLPEFAYYRLQEIIESPEARLETPEVYVVPDEPGKYLSASRTWQAKRRRNDLSVLTG